MSEDRSSELDALFEAGRREQPSPDARRRTLEAVSKAPPRGSLARGWPWLAALAALLAIAVVTVGRPPAPALIGPEQMHAPRRPAPAESPRPPRPLATETSSVPAAVADAAPAPPDPKSDSSPRSSRSRRPDLPRAPSLEAELALLDRARAELARGEAATALSSLDEYDTTLKGTRLALEARLLRIQALAAHGKRAEAATIAREFIARHPDSPLAERARAFAEPHEPR
jgi:hypothetical protein